MEEKLKEASQEVFENFTSNLTVALEHNILSLHAFQSVEPLH
jgi:hypothetical protein